jgi:hypothetical protein
VATASACAAEPLPEPQLYGLYCWASGYVEHADDVQKVGIRWLRSGGWDNQQNADRAALLAARNGVHLVPVIGLREMSHERTMPVEEAVQKVREVCRTCVGRYGPGGTLWRENADVKPRPIRYWQFWNEPNIEFLNPGESGLLRTELYARLLKAASEEIRALDPGAQIIAFNTAGGCPYIGRGVPPDGMWQRLKYIGWRKFIRDVNALVGTDCYDAIGTHPYTQPAAPDGKVSKGIEMIRELGREQKFDKPIWFTEVGYPVEYPRNLNVRDERQQACFATRLYAISGAHGATQVQVMYIQDIIYGPDNTRRSFGFFTEPGKWREQATATEVMIDLIPDPRKDAKIVEESADGVNVFRFKGRGGHEVVMAWNAGEGTVEREFDFKRGVTLVSMLGESDTPRVAGNRIKVALTEAPVYLVYADKAAVDALLKD